MRYLPLQSSERQAMLATIGTDSIDTLFKQATGYTADADFALPPHQDEQATLKYFVKQAERNISTSQVASFLGGGYYRYYIPAAVDYIIQRGEFMTAYTPYQPEIAQGTLQYLFEFQTQVARLTGMDVANASLWDGATGTAEAILMAQRITKRKKARISGNLHPQYADVVRTYCAPLDIDIEQTDVSFTGEKSVDVDDTLATFVVAYPDFFGTVQDFSALATRCQEKGVLLTVVFTNPVPFGLLKVPGDMGADIVVGEGQALGAPLSFGGPGLGLFATRNRYVRQMPGRLVGETVDSENNRMYVLTLVAREQHIRREKATSNICTNSGLCVLTFSTHMTLLGAKGLRSLASADHSRACDLHARLSAIDGVCILNQHFYNEFVVELPINAQAYVEDAVQAGIFAGVPLSRFYLRSAYENLLLVATTQVNTQEEIDTFAHHLQGACHG